MRLTKEDTKEWKHRHPDFDAMWLKYKGLVFWWAKRLQKVFGGRPSDYWGTLTIRFNRALWGHDVTGRKFTTYYCKRIHLGVMQYFLRYESEQSALAWKKSHSDELQQKETEVAYATYESDYHMYRVPPEEDWTKEFIGLFHSKKDVWAFLTKHLPPRDKFVLLAKYKYDFTYRNIGHKLGISKQRIQQLEIKAKDKVRERVDMLTPFMSLFKVPDTEGSQVIYGESGTSDAYNSVENFDNIWEKIEWESGYILNKKRRRA